MTTGQLYQQYEQGLVFALASSGQLRVIRSTEEQRDWLKENIQEVKRLTARPGVSWYGWALEEIYNRTDSQKDRDLLQDLDMDLYAHGPVLETWPSEKRHRFEKAVLRLAQALSGEEPELSGGDLYRAVLEVFGLDVSAATSRAVKEGER